MNHFRFGRWLNFRRTMFLTAGSFVLVAFGVSTVAVVSRDYSRQGTRQTETLTAQFLPGLVTLARLQDAALNLKSIVLQSTLARDGTIVSEQHEAFQSYVAQISKSAAQLTRFAHDEPTRELITAFQAEMIRYRASVETFHEELHAGDFVAANLTLDQQVEPAQHNIEVHLRTLSEHYFELAQAASARTASLLAQSDQFGLFATTALAGFTVLCFILSLVATRALLAQIRQRDSERLAAQTTLERRVEERTVALREAQQQAARDHHRFKFIFDSLPVGVTWTLNGNDATRICNPAYARISGVSEEQGRIPGAYGLATHPDDRAAQAVLHRQLAAGEIDHYQIEKRYVRPDGSLCPAELTIRVFRDPVTRETQEIGMLADLTERKRAQLELEKLHHQLVEASLHAGMAEVATGVLHNIGNVLNSVNVSASLVADQVRCTKAVNLNKLATLFEEHSADLGAFITTDPKGMRIPRYVGQLAAELASERQESIEELRHLQKNIDHIKDIVATQQTYAKVSGVVESVSVSSLVEDSLRMNSSALARHGLEVVRDYQTDPTIPTERHKVLQILINLIRNAKYACDDSNRSDKRVTLRIVQEADRVRIIVADNGVGIPAENLTRIFVHGFTTRKDGHGFGLHSGALAARELGGSLTAQSDGPGLGATFILDLPSAERACLEHAHAA